MAEERVLLSWSSGKDSAWTLQVLRETEDVEVVGLLTTFNESADRVAMHAVRRTLVEAQADAVGLPLISIGLPWPCPNEAYEAMVSRALETAVARLGVTAVAFGDLFLEDIRAYREAKLADTGLTPLFPLWGSPTDTLARDMIDGGLRAHLTCVDPKHLDKEFAGQAFDHSLLTRLPAAVDRCGERGEFHTFAADGPMFDHPIDVEVGDVVHRDGFFFADLLPLVAP